MKIMIMRCNNKNFWYKDSIGKMYPVVRQDSKDYYVKAKGSKAPAAVLKLDCEIVER